jgi:RND superfamily putative drug exporter
MRRRSRGPGGASRTDGGARRHPLLLRHPRRVLAVAFVVLLVLGILGLGVNSKLQPTSLNIAGTPSAKANAMLMDSFGNSAPFAILLRGPAAALDEQGPALIRVLRQDPKVTTLSPWSRGSVARLRPSPDKALILVDFHVDIDQAVNETVPKLNRILEEDIHPPVRATQSGFASISRALQVESISASERGELIAIPILLIVLLLVFRSPVAAAIPLGFGAITVFASRGILYLLTSYLSIDAFALTVTTMMGLALGVDYSLLMVSRFREELAAGAAPIDAAWATRRTAGRTCVFAGSTLMISMVTALFIVPGALLAALAGTVAMVAALSVLVATVVGPALLTLIGPNLDRWRIGTEPTGEESRLMVFVRAAMRRPAPVAALIAAVVLVFAAPAIALKTGPPSPEQLSKGDPARKDAELINHVIGPGWDAPFQIIATTTHGPITEPARLATLDRWQRRFADLPGVQAVVGPGQIERKVTPLRETGNGLLAGGPAGELGELGRKLGVAAHGVSELREGISQASSGAGLLSEGSGRAASGALTISNGLAKASAGSGEAVTALAEFEHGTKKLSAANQEATLGVVQLKSGIESVHSDLRDNALPKARRTESSLKADSHDKLPELIAPAKVADEQLSTALQQLDQMTVGKSDSHYGAALEAVRKASAAVSGTDPVSGQPYAPGYAGLPTELTALQKRLVIDTEETYEVKRFLETEVEHLKKLRESSVELHEGMEKIQHGDNKLVNGSAELARESKSLNSGLTQLTTGSTALARAVTRIGGGASDLKENLAAGYHEAAPLQSGMNRATVQVIASHQRLQRKTGKLRHGSPGLFNSGYFVLSALDGAPKQEREAAAGTIDLRNGGQATTMLVISRYSFNTPGSISLNHRLDKMTTAMGRDADATAGVAGGAAELNDYSRVSRAAIPGVVAAITLATFLVLVIVLRAVPLAAIAVGLNLATVGVAFGVLTLLFNVPAGWPLGGHKYVDAVGATMIFGVVFGLSIDYAVFLLTRMKERFDRDGDHAAAVDFGLEKTARVITGAAAIMMAVFIAFAAAPIATVSQLGVGLTVAVLLDATVVRIVLLPALMLLVGERVWWLPRPLDRVLPHLNV